MATSRFVTTQYSSEEFVESAGAVIFHLSQQKLCLLHLKSRDEWILAKGRRNCGESRSEAAVREAREETGYQCSLLPVIMTTRAPPATETGHTPDVPRVFQAITEPFMITVREGSESRNVKFISWYIAAIDENQSWQTGTGEEGFDADLFSYGEALEKLTFQLDRDIVQRALDIISNTFAEADKSSTTLQLGREPSSLMKRIQSMACAGELKLVEEESFPWYGEELEVSIQSALLTSSNRGD